MKYEDLFQDSESFIQRRLSEQPGEEFQTLKEAGYRNVWKGFVEDFFERDWNNAVRRVDTLEKNASGDAFIDGQLEAVDTILNINQDPKTVGWYQFIKMAHESDDIIEFAESVQDMDVDSLEKEGFLTASRDVIESDKDLVEMALSGPNFLEKEMFELGKEAALNDLVEYANQGAGVSDLIEIVQETLGSDLAKEASEQELDYLHGVESVCHQFLKCASEIYGEFDTSDSYDEDVVEAIFEKIAADEERSLVQKAKDKAKAVGGAIRRNPKKTIAAIAGTALAADQIRRGSKDYKSRRMSPGSSRRSAFTGAVKDRASDVKRNTYGVVKDLTKLVRKEKAPEGQTKTSSFDFGQAEAYQELVDMYENGAEFGDCLTAVSDTLSADLGKHASLEETEYQLGVETACYEFLKVASEITGAFEIDDSDDLLVATLEGMYEDEELPTSDEFDMGKHAALSDLAELIDEHGVGVVDCLSIVQDTLGQELDKNASEEDFDVRRGVEAACYEFLKTASEIYGEFDTSDSDDDEILLAVFEKIAAKDEEKKPGRVRRAANWVKANPKKAIAGTAAALLGADQLRRVGRDYKSLSPTKGERGAALGLALRNRGRAAKAAPGKIKERFSKGASLNLDTQVQDTIGYFQDQGWLDD